MNSQIKARTMNIHRALLVKTNGLPSRWPAIGLIWNWCIGSILDSAATSSFPSALRALPGQFEHFPHGDAETDEQHDHPGSPRAGEAVDRIADQRAAERIAEQDREHAIGGRPIIGRPAFRLPAGPLRLLRLRSGEALV